MIPNLGITLAVALICFAAPLTIRTKEIPGRKPCTNPLVH